MQKKYLNYQRRTYKMKKNEVTKTSETLIQGSSRFLT